MLDAVDLAKGWSTTRPAIWVSELSDAVAACGGKNELVNADEGGLGPGRFLFEALLQPRSDAARLPCAGPDASGRSQPTRDSHPPQPVEGLESTVLSAPRLRTRHSWSGDGRAADPAPESPNRRPGALHITATFVGSPGPLSVHLSGAGGGPFRASSVRPGELEPVNSGMWTPSQPHQQHIAPSALHGGFRLFNSGSWNWRALRTFWWAPAAAAAFASASLAVGLGGWPSTLPGALAMFLMCWVQCAWAVMACQGGGRGALRLAQLAAAALGVLMLLPSRGGPAVGEVAWAALVEGDGNLVSVLRVALGFSLGAGSVAEAGGGIPSAPGALAGVQPLEAVELRRSLLHFQVALVTVVGLWVLQALVAASALAAPTATTGPSVTAGSLPALHKSHLNLPSMDGPNVYDLDFRVGPDVHVTCYGACRPTPGTKEVCWAAASAGEQAAEQQSQPEPVLPSIALAQGLLVTACAAQCAAAVALVGVWELPPGERIYASPGSPLASTYATADSRRSLYGTVATSCAAVGLLAVATAAPLLFPAALRTGHLLHTALLLRPAASRGLGLRLLDANAAKLLFALAMGLLLGWRAAIFTWQTLQVCTLVAGMAALYCGGVQQEAQRLLAPASGSCATCGSDDVPSLHPVDRAIVYPVALGSAHGVPAASAAARGPDAAEVRKGATVACEGGTEASCSPTGHASLATASDVSSALLSPCSSGHSLASGACGAGYGGEPQCGRHAVANGCGAAGNGLGTPAPAGAMQRPRRPVPQAHKHLQGPQHHDQHHHYHHEQQYHHHYYQQQQLPATPRSGGGAKASGCANCCAWARAFARAASTPWSLVLGSLTSLACLLWLMLIAPPLALLGEGLSDLFQALLGTAPGVAALVWALAATAAAMVAAAGCLLWCAASGELQRRWRLDRVEGRRLQCLAWACGPALAVAAASALSWALGEERNAVAFVVAEVLRCAALWPLVWLQEPWLLGGVDSVGGCVQHAGCGVTCCVLRWCGLRPRSCAVPGGRCGVPENGGGSRERDSGQSGVARGQASRRGHWNLQVEVN